VDEDVHCLPVSLISCTTLLIFSQVQSLWRCAKSVALNNTNRDTPLPNPSPTQYFIPYLTSYAPPPTKKQESTVLPENEVPPNKATPSECNPLYPLFSFSFCFFSLLQFETTGDSRKQGTCSPGCPSAQKPRRSVLFTQVVPNNVLCAFLLDFRPKDSFQLLSRAPLY